MADRIARRYRNRGLGHEDLTQTALLAMIRAVDRYDPTFGAGFATFAGRTIEGEMKRMLRDKAWAVRPPRGAQERHLVLRKREEELTHRLGRSPTVAELAAAMDATIDEVIEAIEAGGARSAGGLQRTNEDGEEVDSEHLLADEELGFGHVGDRLLVDELLGRLDERAREVVVLTFFERRTQAEIAERLGLSQSYLSRLLRRTLVQLRDLAEAPADDGAGDRSR